MRNGKTNKYRTVRRPQGAAKASILVLSIAGGFLGLVATAIAQSAGDADRGKVASSKCIGCHGSAGQHSPGTPAIAGQAPSVLITKLNAYRSGEKNHLLMSRAARDLTDSEIADLAAYYSSLERP